MTEATRLAFDALNAALKAAGEDTRLRVLVLLSEAELTVSDLTQILRQSQPRISRHLKLLSEAGLIERHREGSWAFFRVADQEGGAEMVRLLSDYLDPDDPVLARDLFIRKALVEGEWETRHRFFAANRELIAANAGLAGEVAVAYAAL